MVYYDEDNTVNYTRECLHTGTIRNGRSYVYGMLLTARFHMCLGRDSNQANARVDSFFFKTMQL